MTITNILRILREKKLLKLEAEGYEFDVLTGAKKSLEKIKYITADLGFELSNNTESSFDDVNKFLLQNILNLLIVQNEILIYIRTRTTNSIKLFKNLIIGCAKIFNYEIIYK